MASDRYKQTGGTGTAAHTIRWNGKAVKVKPLLPPSEMSEFLNSVMDACVMRESVMPEFMDLAIRANTVLYYTDAELPETLDGQTELLYGTDLYDTVREHICKAQLDALIHAAEICMRGSM